MQVIEYVQYLQEKVQKYEGSYQNWGGEPTKLIPWVKTKALPSFYLGVVIHYLARFSCCNSYNNK